jgi:hypothetical protein
MSSNPRERVLPNRIVIEEQAKTILDPIERLRFLRTNAGAELGPLVAPPEKPPWWVSVPKRWAAALALGAAVLALIGVSRIHRTPLAVPPAAAVPAPPARAGAARPVNKVWLVDQKESVETYSNGLRVDTSFEVANEPRGEYIMFPRDQVEMKHALKLADPAGIVYHTTESRLAPFDATQNTRLQRISVEVLRFVQHNHSYHFLIDRFGRVYRVVKESDIAFHAGNSVWGDANRIFLNLNNSFLGVAFETQTRPGEGLPTATPAQIDAARVLTEMLRDRYKIPGENCVTHAQVSVNPSNMIIGYHTDWAGKFPFLELGLNDNYALPPASLSAFGFDYDPAFVASTGSRLTPGLLAAESDIRDRAAKLNCTVSQLKSRLKSNYKEIAAAVKSGESAKGDSQ